jgi:hypothetical protein
VNIKRRREEDPRKWNELSTLVLFSSSCESQKPDLPGYALSGL